MRSPSVPRRSERTSGSWGTAHAPRGGTPPIGQHASSSIRRAGTDRLWRGALIIMRWLLRRVRCSTRGSTPTRRSNRASLSLTAGATRPACSWNMRPCTCGTGFRNRTARNASSLSGPPASTFLRLVMSRCMISRPSSGSARCCPICSARVRSTTCALSCTRWCPISRRVLMPSAGASMNGSASPAGRSLSTARSTHAPLGCCTPTPTGIRTGPTAPP